jgi:hypothetical protein
MVILTETCSKLYIIEYIAVFCLKDTVVNHVLSFTLLTEILYCSDSRANTHHRNTTRIRNNQLFELICTSLLSYIWTSTFSQLGSTTDGTTTIQHTGHVTTRYMIYHPFYLYFK